MGRSSSNPFLDPLWRRILLIAAITAWCAVEFYNGEQTWGMIVGGMAIYGAYTYLLTYRPSTAAASKAEADKE
jgi:hypothetical protein